MKKNIRFVWTILVSIIGICGFTIIGIGRGDIKFVLSLNWTVLIGLLMFLIWLMFFGEKLSK